MKYCAWSIEKKVTESSPDQNAVNFACEFHVRVDRYQCNHSIDMRAYRISHKTTSVIITKLAISDLLNDRERTLSDAQVQMRIYVSIILTIRSYWQDETSAFQSMHVLHWVTSSQQTNMPLIYTVNHSSSTTTNTKWTHQSLR